MIRVFEFSGAPCQMPLCPTPCPDSDCKREVVMNATTLSQLHPTPQSTPLARHLPRTGRPRLVPLQPVDVL
jgi:hypothetical protein